MMDTDIIISSDKSLLDVEKVHNEVKNSYWGGYRTREQTQRTIDNSICFGVYRFGEQIGFARVLTDGVVFAHLMDIMIFGTHKNKGLGKKLVQHILQEPMVKEVLTICLKTKDAHAFYGKYGFEKVGDSVLWMAIDRTKLD